MSRDPRTRRRPTKIPAGITIRERRDKHGIYYRFQIRWTDPATHRKLAEQFDTLAEAVDFKARLRRLKGRGELDDLDRGTETLDAFARDWLTNHASATVSERTLRNYIGVYNKHLHPHIGGLQLRQLRPKVVDQLRQQMLNEGVGQPTVRRALAILSSMLSQAVVWDRITANPVLSVRKPSARRHKVIRPLSVNEVEALLVELAQISAQDRILGELLAYTGARPQDALALTYDRVADRIHYTHKNVDGVIVPGSKTGEDRTRTVNALGTIRRDLLAHRAITPDATGTSLIISRADGQPWTDTDYKNWTRKHPRGRRDPITGQRTGPLGPFTRAARAADLPHDITPYYLRHTYASLRIAEQRLSMKEISDELGHSVETLATHYAHVIDEYAGQGPIDPDQLIQTARTTGLNDREGRQKDAKHQGDVRA